MVILWSNDLLFKSKVRNAAGDAPVAFAGALPQLVERLAAGDITRVIVDMDVNTSDLMGDLARVVEAAKGAELVIFGSHMRVDIMEAARGLGFHKALARSAFVRDMPYYVA